MADSGIEAPRDRTGKQHRSPSEKTAIPIKEINGFELISKIGQGGMGTVFKARQKSLDRMVALKILPPSFARNKRFIERFQREARASAKLWNPHIVQGIDVGQDSSSGLWYFAMEYIDGPSLMAVLKKDIVISEKRSLEILSQVGLALQAVADAGMVHRDIKPDNIMLTGTGIAKLADLGLAKEVSDDAGLTQSGHALGTPNYMAPEQIRGEENIDIRADLYALGATLFHLVIGHAPFKGRTSAEVQSKHLVEVAPLAHTINPYVSEECSMLIAKLLEKNRENRIQTPKELLERIAVLLKQKQDKAGARLAVENKHVANGKRSSGGHKTARKDSTALRSPIGSGSTGPLNPVDDSATDPRKSIHSRTTGHLDPVEDRIFDLASTPKASVLRPATVVWLGIGLLATLVLVATILAYSRNSNKHNDPAKADGGRSSLDSRLIVREEKVAVISPAKERDGTSRPPEIANGIDQQQERAKTALDSAVALEASHPDDFPVLMAAFTEACELNRDSALNGKAGAGLLAVESRWKEAFALALKPAVEHANACNAKGDFAGALDALKDSAVPDNLRAKDWAQRLEALRKPIRDGAETTAASLLDQARSFAQAGDAAGLQKAIDTAQRAAAISPAIAPSSTKAAHECAVWAATLATLIEKNELDRKARLKLAKELAMEVRKELQPLCQQNRFSAAADLLDKKMHEPGLAGASELLQIEMADLQAIIALRQRAIDALRTMKDKTVSIKKGTNSFTGTIQAGTSLPGVTLMLGGDAELTFAPEQLEALDIDGFAPVQAGAERAEDLRRRGLLFLAAGELNKARDFFKAARDAGKGDEITPYFERIDNLEMGDAEIRARTDWNAAEALVAAQRWKEAQLAYATFALNHAKTNFLMSVAAQLKVRIESVERILNPPVPGLFGTYYKDKNFEPPVLLSRVDNTIDFDWSGKPPTKEVPHDYYCVRWEGLIKITKAGHYTFATVTDDGNRLWVDGKLLVDEWHPQSSRRHSSDIDLTEGQYEIKLEYFQDEGQAVCRLYWALQNGFSEEIIPGSALFHIPTPVREAKK